MQRFAAVAFVTALFGVFSWVGAPALASLQWRFFLKDEPPAWLVTTYRVALAVAVLAVGVLIALRP